MKYVVIPPPLKLKNHVRYFWTMESDIAQPSPCIIGPLADGFPGIMIQNNELGFYSDQNGHPLSEAFVYGQTIKQTNLLFSGKFSTVGVSFFPTSLNLLFGFDAHELTDTCVGLNEVIIRKQKTIVQQLKNTPTLGDQVEIISSALFAQANKTNAYPDHSINYALSQIIDSHGKISLEKLRKKLSISERGLERKFKQHVGVSPKSYAMICRFQEALNQLKNKDYEKLSDIAYDNNFADQSHFIRVFKTFTGLSPFQFQKQMQEENNAVDKNDHLPKWLN